MYAYKDTHTHTRITFCLRLSDKTWFKHTWYQLFGDRHSEREGESEIGRYVGNSPTLPWPMLARGVNDRLSDRCALLFLIRMRCSLPILGSPGIAGDRQWLTAEVEALWVTSGCSADNDMMDWVMSRMWPGTKVAAFLQRLSYLTRKHSRLEVWDGRKLFP